MDKIFKVDLERGRIYWDYYRTIFTVMASLLCSGIIATALIYTGKEVSLTVAAGVIVLLALTVVLLAALMSLYVWRHEERHLDELIRAESDIISAKPPETLV